VADGDPTPPQGGWSWLNLQGHGCLVANMEVNLLKHGRGERKSEGSYVKIHTNTTERNMIKIQILKLKI
jgi:hypothetical protein